MVDLVPSVAVLEAKGLTYLERASRTRFQELAQGWRDLAEACQTLSLIVAQNSDAWRQTSAPKRPNHRNYP